MSPKPLRYYPSITALRCFVTAAQYLSFTKASHVLHMSQSAVSKQILQLEDVLDFPLFERMSTGLQLSPQGRDFYEHSLKILNQLEWSVYQVQSQHSENCHINIVAHPSLCTRWLLPLLKSFKQQYPHIQYTIREQTNSSEIQSPYIDVAFLYGTGHWSNKDTVKLFDEQCIAVASPDIGQLPFNTLNQFQDFDLIQLQPRMQAWHDYFGLQHSSLASSACYGIGLDSFNATIQAAKLGYGIALVPTFFVAQELAVGELIQVWPFKMPTKQSYYICYEKNISVHAPAQLLIQWMAQQMASENLYTMMKTA